MKQQLLFLIFSLGWIFTPAQGQKALTHKIIEAYDVDSGTYTEVLKEAYSYNTKGQLSETEFSYIGATDWTPSVKMSYSYHTNGYLKETITSNWDEMSNTYMNYRRDVIEYEGNHMKEQILYNWMNNDWKRDEKTTFNVEGTVLKTYDTYEWENEQWKNDGKGTLEYDEQQKVIEIVTEELEDNVWLPDDRTSYLRDPSSGRVTEIIYETWNGSNWVKDDRIVYAIDTEGNRLNLINSESPDGVNWIEEVKIEYEYDLTTSMSSYNNPYNVNTYLQVLGLEEVPHHNKVVLSVESGNADFDSAASGQEPWEVESQTIYYYSDGTMGLKDLSDTDFISVYPNPVNRSLNIKLREALTANARLYDINGRLVLEQQLQPLNSSLNVERLNSGTYLLKITTEVGFAHKRITKY